MDKPRKQIRAEEENVEIALGNLKQTIEREEKTILSSQTNILDALDGVWRLSELGFWR